MIISRWLHAMTHVRFYSLCVKSDWHSAKSVYINLCNVNTVDFVIYCFYRCFTDCNFCECIKMYYIFSTLLSSAFFVSYHWIFKCVRILWVVYCMMLHEQTIQTLLLMLIFLRNMSNKQKSMSFLCKIEWNCQK